MPYLIRRIAAATQHVAPLDQISGEVPADVGLYNAAAWHHEHLIEKYCALLGTTLAGVVSHEDRVAVAYLRSRRDVAAERVGCERIGAAVVVGMMSTYRGLLDHNVADHTWMLFPPEWARHGDWPDLVGCRAPSPLLVQYDRDDHLFTLAGMHAAHQRIAAHYCHSGRPDAYAGQFYDGPHKFDLAMQQAAFAWLHQQLEPAPRPRSSIWNAGSADRPGTAGVFGQRRDWCTQLATNLPQSCDDPGGGRGEGLTRHNPGLMPCVRPVGPSCGHHRPSTGRANVT